MDFQVPSEINLKAIQKNILKGDTLYLSKIFDWYGDDFSKTYGSYKKYVKKNLKIIKDVKIKFNSYDWKLNDYKVGQEVKIDMVGDIIIVLLDLQIM